MFIFWIGSNNHILVHPETISIKTVSFGVGSVVNKVEYYLAIKEIWEKLQVQDFLLATKTIIMGGYQTQPPEHVDLVEMQRRYMHIISSISGLSENSKDLLFSISSGSLNSSAFHDLNVWLYGSAKRGDFLTYERFRAFLETFQKVDAAYLLSQKLQPLPRDIPEGHSLVHIHVESEDGVIFSTDIIQALEIFTFGVKWVCMLNEQDFEPSKIVAADIKCFDFMAIVPYIERGATFVGSVLGILSNSFTIKAFLERKEEEDLNRKMDLFIKRGQLTDADREELYRQCGPVINRLQLFPDLIQKRQEERFQELVKRQSGSMIPVHPRVYESLPGTSPAPRNIELDPPATSE